MAKKRKAAKKVSTSKKPYVVKDQDEDLENLYKFVSDPKNKNRIIHAYKYTDANGKGPYQPVKSITYAVGKTYEVKRWSNNRREDCGRGLHVATKKWCLHDTRYRNGYLLFLVRIKVKDVVCVPFGTLGKFRVKKLKVIKLIKNGDTEWASG